MSCDYIRTIAVAEENPIYHSAGNCLIETKTKTLVIGCQTSVIPDDGSVTRIGDLAFYEGPITRLILPEGITELGHDALAFTQLSAIHIPSTLSEIAVTAFDGCRQLDTITVSPDHPRFIAEGSCLIDTTSDVLVIGGNAAEIPQDGSVRALNGHSFFGRNIPHAELPEALVFLGDSSFVDSTLESVYIPGKINAILAFTFSGCRQLERVYIPRAVKTIDANAFHSCTSLKNI